MKIASLILGALFGSCTGIPKHSFFQYEEETGLIRLQEKQELRLNVKGGAIEEPGAPVILWPCAPLNHELFKFEDNLIKLKVNQELCLNAQGGAVAGNNVTLWPCEHGGTRVPHEEFELRSDGRIAMKTEPNMCLNVKGGAIEHGAEIITYYCGSGEAANELFIVEGDMIRVKGKPEFHFNIQGELQAGSKVVLWSCQAGPHEAFEFTDDSRIRLKMKSDLCLNSEQGVAAGHRIIAWPCSPKAEPNELFIYKGNTIYSATNTDLGFNAAGGGMSAGDEIVLWPFNDEL